MDGPTSSIEHVNVSREWWVVAVSLLKLWSERGNRVAKGLERQREA